MFLKTYSVPETYNEIFQHNLEEVNGIDSDELLENFVEKISLASGIEFRVVLIELKRYLMTAQEYFPHLLKRSFTQKFVSLLKIIGKFVLSRPPELMKAEILIDDWSPGVTDHFYSGRLLGNLNRTHKIENFSNSSYIKLSVLKEYLFPLLLLYPLTKSIYEKHGVDLAHFLYRFVVDFTVGKSLQQVGLPKLVISGNDNGFPVIKAKAGGSRSILIQNGLRINVSDSSFKYADNYIAMGSDEFQKVRRETGCSFDRKFFWGSIRLHNFVNGSGGYDNKFDILFAESMYIHTSDGSAHYYRNEDERKIIPLLNSYAAKKRCRIAYKARTRESIAYLRNQGLLSPDIYYTYDENIYELVMQSSIVLSSFSTICLEAMAVNRKTGFVNFSGNRHLNKIFRRLDIELMDNSYDSFCRFIDRLESADNECGRWIIQNPNFSGDLIALADSIIGKNPCSASQ